MRFAFICGRSKIGCDSEVRFGSNKGGRGIRMEFRRGPRTPAEALPGANCSYGSEALQMSKVVPKCGWKLALIIGGSGGLLSHRRQNLRVALKIHLPQDPNGAGPTPTRPLRGPPSYPGTVAVKRRRRGTAVARHGGGGGVARPTPQRASPTPSDARRQHHCDLVGDGCVLTSATRRF